MALVREGHVFNNGDLNSYLRVVTEDPEVSFRALVQSGRQRNFGKKMLAPKTVNQRRYLEAIERNDLVFGVGPAGTGKTYLAVAMAVSALLRKRVSRIILTRPAVEAGERLGFLPGTLAGEGRSLPAPALRRPVRHDGIREGRQAAGTQHHRGRAHRLHARPHAQRQFHHPGRSPEQHHRADEDGADAHGLQFQNGGERRHYADRSAARASAAA